MFENKLVAILNKNIETVIAMNALAHMAIGLGAQLNNDMLRLENYEDKEGNIFPHISQMPFIILQGTSHEIKKTVCKAKEENLKYGVFVDTMTGGTYQQQLDRTRSTTSEELVYYGAVLFGEWEKVSNLTKKLSLYKRT